MSKTSIKKSEKILNLNGKETRENGTTLYFMDFLIDNDNPIQRFQ